MEGRYTVGQENILGRINLYQIINQSDYACNHSECHISPVVEMRVAWSEGDKKARSIMEKLLKEEYSVYEKYPETLVWRLCTEHVDSALLALGIGRREVLRICLGIISDIFDMNEVNVQEE